MFELKTQIGYIGQECFICYNNLNSCKHEFYCYIIKVAFQCEINSVSLYETVMRCSLLCPSEVGCRNDPFQMEFAYGLILMIAFIRTGSNCVQSSV